MNSIDAHLLGAPLLEIDGELWVQMDACARPLATRQGWRAALLASGATPLDLWASSGARSQWWRVADLAMASGEVMVATQAKQLSGASRPSTLSREPIAPPPEAAQPARRRDHWRIAGSARVPGSGEALPLLACAARNGRRYLLRADAARLIEPALLSRLQGALPALTLRLPAEDLRDVLPRRKPNLAGLDWTLIDADLLLGEVEQQARAYAAPTATARQKRDAAQRRAQADRLREALGEPAALSSQLSAISSQPVAAAAASIQPSAFSSQPDHITQLEQTFAHPSAAAPPPEPVWIPTDDAPARARDPLAKLREALAEIGAGGRDPRVDLVAAEVARLASAHHALANHAQRLELRVERLETLLQGGALALLEHLDRREPAPAAAREETH